jgi:brefeldin A-inhibited guanine nucleotide-exchange protein
MYCLQRLIEMGFYNMNRIRLEWVNIWAKLREHFIQVCTFPNATVGFFALDKLRQLAMKFLDLEELSNFKFQKDFLWPFEEILLKSLDPKIKDMVLACIQQMVQAKSKKFRSGWKAIFATISKSAKESHGTLYFINLVEPIVVLSLDIIKMIYKSSFDEVIANNSLPEFIICLTDLAKNSYFSKTKYFSFHL